jgi:uncharacterized membrane protein
VAFPAAQSRFDQGGRLSFHFIFNMPEWTPQPRWQGIGGESLRISVPAMAFSRNGGLLVGQAALWAPVSVLLVLVVMFSGEPTRTAQVVAALGIVGSIALAARIYRLLGAAILLCESLLITFVVENMGVATGLPFGHYHFEVGADLPHIGAVPLVVGFLYFGVGFLSWITASTLGLPRICGRSG